MHFEGAPTPQIFRALTLRRAQKFGGLCVAMNRKQFGSNLTHTNGAIEGHKNRVAPKIAREAVVAGKTGHTAIAIAVMPGMIAIAKAETGRVF